MAPRGPDLEPPTPGPRPSPAVFELARALARMLADEEGAADAASQDPP